MAELVIVVNRKPKTHVVHGHGGMLQWDNPGPLALLRRLVAPLQGHIERALVKQGQRLLNLRIGVEFSYQWEYEPKALRAQRARLLDRIKGIPDDAHCWFLQDCVKAIDAELTGGDRGFGSPGIDHAMDPKWLHDRGAKKEDRDE